MSNKKKKQFMTLYEPIHAQFERFCKARAYGEMNYEDLMQETIVVAFEKLDQLHSNTVFLSFLFGISTRILANANRKLREERLPHQLEIVQGGKNAGEHNLEIEELYKALGKIPELQREALILFEISGFSVKEIACIQESSEDAVKQRLSRGRKELLIQLTEKTQTAQTIAV